ncbi:MAG: RND transporter [Thiobacillus sp. 65-69]|nr:efflux transporter outer membrane subunit [Thiobacillus sp.]ODU89503.1 MAG: RND transporter [Thiobacillus sp. SCN 65-179]OJW37432.1 MAG: RND transporter [Thiobacillus sp. 65-69]
MFTPALRHAWGALVCLTLAGCAAVGPDYLPPASDAPADWHQLTPSATPAARAQTADDLTAWWQQLNDSLLTQLMDEALRASPDLQSARAKLREARARRDVADAGRYPELSASGNASRSRSSRETGSGATRNFFSAGFDASWELDVFGGTRRAIEASEADLDTARASLDDTRVTLVAEVASAYVNVRALQLRLGIARANLAAQTETLQLTDWRQQAGLANTQDVEQARTNLEQTRAQIPALQASLTEAEHQLDVLLGLQPGNLHARLAGAGDLPALPARIAVGIPADTLRMRPDVRAAERRLAAETARVGVAEAARYPGFALNGSIGVEALTLGALGSGNAGTSSLLAGIAAPLFNAGRLRAQADAQDAVREQAQIAYTQSLLAALQDVENALSALARSQERQRALTDAADAARNAAALARQRYTAGLIDFQSVLDTERTRLSVEDSLAGTRADGVLALIRLYKALGGGWPPQASGKDAS